MPCGFLGQFPEDLQDLFPWEAFFLGTQRDYLMKEAPWQHLPAGWLATSSDSGASHESVEYGIFPVISVGSVGLIH